jgi:hypothetical protein
MVNSDRLSHQKIASTTESFVKFCVRSVTLRIGEGCDLDFAL